MENQTSKIVLNGFKSNKLVVLNLSCTNERETFDGGEEEVLQARGWENKVEQLKKRLTLMDGGEVAPEGG